MYIQLHDTYVLICMVLKHIDDTWVYGVYVLDKSVYHCCCMVYGYRLLAQVFTLVCILVVLGLSLYNRPQLRMVLPFGISKFFDVYGTL